MKFLLRASILLSCFFLWLVSPQLVLATTTINVIGYPTLVTVKEPFDVQVALSGLEIGEKYLIKSIGGEDWRKVKTWSENRDNWLAWNGPWEDMPQASASAEGEASVTVSSLFIKETLLGSNPYKIRIRKGGSETNFDSAEITLLVAAAPTATPTPTAAPEPTATPTPRPTNTPTPKPTVTPTPKPTKVPTLSPTPSPAEGEVLGEEAENISPPGSLEETVTINEVKKEGPGKRVILPIMAVVFGLGMLGAAAYFGLRKGKEVFPADES